MAFQSSRYPDLAEGVRSGEALMNVGSVRDNNEKSEMSVITEGAVSH